MIAFEIHRNFFDSWQKLALQDRIPVKRFLSMLLNNDITPGMRPHPVCSFISYSPNMDLRIIACEQNKKIILIYVDHHDAAYKWAKRTRILETNTDSIELIDLERFYDKDTLHFQENNDFLPLPIQRLIEIQDEDRFLSVISSLSPEWQEWLVDKYLGENCIGTKPKGTSLVYSPVDDDDLLNALELNFPAWYLFLHPKQKEIVLDKSQSISILGGPGTGKTTILLNRLIKSYSQKKKDKCTVLLTFSKSLAGYYVDVVKGFFPDKYFYIFPIYYLGLSEMKSQKFNSDTRKNDYKIYLSEQNVLFIKYKNFPPLEIEELIIDEVQDISESINSFLRTLILSGKTRVVLSADINQSLFTVNSVYVNELLNLCIKNYKLSYCYRSTKQIIDFAEKWLSEYHIQIANSCYALSGLKVNIIECDGEDEQITIAEKIMSDLEKRYEEKSLALIFCQFFMPGFTGNVDSEELKLKQNKELAKYFKFASTTKGREYFSGIIFIPKSYLAKGTFGNNLRINTLYVAITRFRDEITILFPKNAAIREDLVRTSGIYFRSSELL